MFRQDMRSGNNLWLREKSEPMRGLTVVMREDFSRHRHHNESPKSTNQSRLKLCQTLHQAFHTHPQ